MVCQIAYRIFLGKKGKKKSATMLHACMDYIGLCALKFWMTSDQNSKAKHTCCHCFAWDKETWSLAQKYLHRCCLFSLAEGSMVLSAVTENVSKTAIVSLVLLQVGALLVVARRRSCSLILCAILTSILLICATLTFTMLNLSNSPALGMFPFMELWIICKRRATVMQIRLQK